MSETIRELPASNRVESEGSGEKALADLVAEITDRLHRGEPVDLESCIARHPEFAERLPALLPALELLHALGSSSGAASAPADSPESAGGTLGDLGDFRILREVGRGGMGIVYDAEQMSLKRRVALKVLPFAGAMDSRQLQRFKNESQAAAQLHHTNIVPVYYVGCERGVHFYAMQFIEGHSLADVIAELRGQTGDAATKPQPSPSPPVEATVDAPAGQLIPPDSANGAVLQTKPIAALSTVRSVNDAAYFRAVAELGIQAAEALDFAHEHGIVHRDIKPTNLLLENCSLPTAHCPPRLWVTDFGLAQVQGDARMTMTGDLVGTLRYMSPEQALAKRVVVDHRTDVYSLGATLYELLTLEQAFSGTDRQELLRQIAFEEPRGVRQFNKVIPTEMGTIVLKAMEKNPADRFATAKELADDLRRFVLDQPIQARRPSLAQRLRKWGRGHQAAVAPALVFLVLAVLVLAGSTLWVWRAAQAEKAAKETAQKRLEQIEKANVILGSIFKQLDPRAEEQGGPTLRVQLGEHLEEAANLLEGEGVGDPLVVARLQEELATSLMELGHYEKAQPLLEKAYHNMEAELGSDDLVTIGCKQTLAMLYKNMGKYNLAELFAEEVFQARAANQGADHENTLTTKNNLALTYHAQGKHAQAEPLYKEVLEVQSAKLGAEHPHTLNFKNNLAVLYMDQSKYDQAEPLIQEVLAARTAKLRADHPHALLAKENLAVLYHMQGKHQRAEKLYQEVLQARLAKLGAAHPDSLTTMNNLAVLYKEQGKYAKAEALLQEALQAQSAKLGADHPECLTTKHNLAGLYQTQWKYDLAEPLYREVVQARTTKLGANHPHTLQSKNGLALLYQNQKKHEQAETLYKEVLQSQTAKLEADHPDTLASRHNLAVLYKAQRKYEGAEALLKEALTGRMRKLGADHPDSLTSMNELAGLYDLQKKYDLAEPLYSEAAQAFTAKLGAEHPNTLICKHNLAMLYHAQGNNDKAETLLRELIEPSQQGFGADTPHYAQHLACLGHILLKQNKPGEAEQVLRQLLGFREKKEPEAWTTFNTKSQLGGAMLAQKKYADAEPLLLQGYEGMKQRSVNIPIEGKVRLTEALERLVQLYDSWGQKDKADAWRKKLPPELVLPPKQEPSP
jgi:non-specific serine/threonine protein kinase/serine/threonine-protein kinase